MATLSFTTTRAASLNGLCSTSAFGFAVLAGAPARRVLLPDAGCLNVTRPILYSLIEFDCADQLRRRENTCGDMVAEDDLIPPKVQSSSKPLLSGIA